MLLVSDASKKLGMTTQTLRLALQQNKFSFGVAIRTSPNRYVYYINRNRLEKYLKGADYETSVTDSNDSTGTNGLWEAGTA